MTTTQSGKTRRKLADQRGLELARKHGFDCEVHLLCYLLMDCYSLKCIGEFLGGCQTHVAQRLRRWGLKSLRKKGGNRWKKDRENKKEQSQGPVVTNFPGQNRCKCGGLIVPTEYGYDRCLRCGFKLEHEPEEGPTMPSIVERIEPCRTHSRRKTKRLKVDPNYIYGADCYL